MELKDCSIGKIVKAYKGIPAHITGLGLNCSGEVVLEVEYPNVNFLSKETIESMKADPDYYTIASICASNNGKKFLIHPSNVEEL